MPLLVEGKTNMHTDFWESSWQRIDEKRLMEYAERKEQAVRELCRITKPGGIILLTLDGLDEEYQKEPHTVTEEGDYQFTEGKWKGMVFHPYSAEETAEFGETAKAFYVESLQEGLLVRLEL